jgi:hypothetical protein
VSVIIQKRVIPMKCHRCTHELNYAGGNLFYASCPHCRTQLSVRKHKLQTGQSLGRPGQSVGVVAQLQQSTGGHVGLLLEHV